MASKCSYFLLGGHVPQSSGSITASGGQLLPIGAKDHLLYRALMALQHSELIPLPIPQPHGIVAATADDSLSVVADGH